MIKFDWVLLNALHTAATPKGGNFGNQRFWVLTDAFVFTGRAMLHPCSMLHGLRLALSKSQSC